LPDLFIEAISALQGGGQTYLINLLENFPDDWNHRLRVIAIVPPALKDSIATSSNCKAVSPEFDTSNIFRRFYWQKTCLPRLLEKSNCDLLFSPGGFLPVRDKGRVKTAVTFQNMLPFDDSERSRFPHGYIRTRLKLLKYLQGSSIKKADLVIFISEYAKNAIDKILPNRRGRSVVIPHGLSDHFREKSLVRPQGLKGIEYVLYVSILFNYKAQLEVIQAWAKVRRIRSTPEKLLLVGPEYKPYARRVRKLIDSLKLNDEVILTGPVPYSELPSYYQNAKINLFASSCENCPNILLEALAGGRPVLCSNYPPMPEFGGDSVEYFDPYNPDELADLLLKYLDDEELCASMGKKAFDHSFKYDWKESATKTWNALAELAEN
jgi:glycosyltransferase involved in cell wall biosynthesis